MEQFLTIAITEPTPQPGEAGVISRLLESRAIDYVHIRRPGTPTAELRRLVEAIPSALRLGLRLHDCFNLAAEMQLGGVHLNSRNLVAPPGVRSVTASCHSLREIADAPDSLLYTTLSPVFDSISKPGYTARFNLEDLKGTFRGKSVIALGGVTPADFPALGAAGFAGAAMLGYVWQRADSLDMLIDEILKYKQAAHNGV